MVGEGEGRRNQGGGEEQGAQGDIVGGKGKEIGIRELISSSRNVSNELFPGSIVGT